MNIQRKLKPLTIYFSPLIRAVKQTLLISSPLCLTACQAYTDDTFGNEKFGLFLLIVFACSFYTYYLQLPR